jgi:hypothetical protein
MARKVFSSGLSAQARSSAVVQPSTAAPGVSQILAGTGITVDPKPGTGIVKVTATGGAGDVVGPGSSIFFNVQSYGAVNGSGQTSTVQTANANAINAAIAALNANGGGTLYFPGGGVGIYYVNAAISSITVPCTVLGDGRDCTKVQQSNASEALKIDTVYSVTLRGIALQTTGGTSSCTITASSVPPYYNGGSIIDACSFIGGTNSINLNVAGIMVSKSIFTQGTNGVNITNVVSLDKGGGTFVNCTFDGSTTGVLAYVDGLKFDHCLFQGGGWGFTWQHTNGQVSADLWFTGCQFEDFASGACEFNGPATSGRLTRVIIADCEFEPGGNCQYIDFSPSAYGAWVDNLVISGSDFSPKDAGNYTVSCVKLYRCVCVSILGNVFWADTNQTGVYVDASCSNGSCGSTNRINGGGTLLVNNGGFVTT